MHTAYKIQKKLMTMLEQQEQVENTEQYTEQKFGIWNSKYSNYKKLKSHTYKSRS